MSYPVLDAVQGLPNPELVTVYPDNSDPNLFYFVPTSVALVRNEDKVRLGVQYWGLTGSDPAGVGAALTFSVEPAIDSDVVNRVATDLKTKNPNARFAFPALVKSSMDVVLNGAFFPDKQDTTAPTTKGGTIDATQAFSISLNGVGARAFAQGVAPDSDVLGARYTYSFLGIEKRLHARITAKYKMIYDHFSTTSTTSSWWGMAKSSWAVDWQQLRQDEAIHVKILEGGETDEDEYILEVFKALVTAQINGEGIFKPVLKPGGLTAKPEAVKYGWGFSGSAAWEHIDEKKTLTIEIDKQKLGEREFQAGLTFSAVCARYPENFADLTTIGNQCVDETKMKEVQKEAIRCLEAKLRRLKKWCEDGLIPESVYLEQVAKAYNEPCYGEENLHLQARFESHITEALHILETASNRGVVTAQGRIRIAQTILEHPYRLQVFGPETIIGQFIETVGPAVI